MKLGSTPSCSGEKEATVLRDNQSVGWVRCALTVDSGVVAGLAMLGVGQTAGLVLAQGPAQEFLELVGPRFGAAGGFPAQPPSCHCLMTSRG